MAVVYWIGGTGAQSWATTGNWSSGALPANGDSVYILSGTSDITSGLNQSAVTVTKLVIGSGFTGTIGVAGDAGAYLQLGVTTLTCIAAVTSSGFLSGGFTRFKWDPGAVDYVAEIQATGTSADTGRGALQIKGGNTASTLDVVAGAVDVATKPGETATLATLKVGGTGVVTTGSGLTCPTITQSGANSILTTGSAVTTLTQYSGTLNTFGTALLTTVKVNGTANFLHRPTGNAFTNLTLDPAAVVDFTGDLRTVLFANAPSLYAGASIKAYNKAHLQLSGPASIQFALLDCGFADVTIDLGSNLTLTVA